jgi:hypothetical protein
MYGEIECMECYTCGVGSMLRCTIYIVEPSVYYNEQGVEMIVCGDRKLKYSTLSIQRYISFFMLDARYNGYAYVGISIQTT